ncbi:MAG TPA: alpha-L-fucosidase [Cellvibrionaceae bacterium]
MKTTALIALLTSSLALTACDKPSTAPEEEQAQFTANVESLEQVNPAPEWFKDAKFGIYFHWGVYATPAFYSEWYPRNMYQDDRPEYEHHVETYGHPDDWPYHYFITGAEDKNGNFVQFAPRLKSEGGKFDPDAWAELFAQSGARFAGPVAEHHDGFSMWDSDINPWNAVNHGPQTDLVAALAEAIRARDMKLILSMHHAYNITGFFENAPQQQDPELQMLYGQMGKEKNEAVWLEKHKEIINKFQPDIIWQDFNLTELSEPVLLEFLAYYYNHAAGLNKEVVATYKDALNPKLAVLDYERGGPKELTEDYWLTDDALSETSWSYTEGISYYPAIQVLHSFFDRISKNGNLLLNISPLIDGTIPQAQQDILLAMGDWLGRFGEAVYATRAWEVYGEGPTQMGSGHHHAEGASFARPTQGTPEDIRFTRSKDKTSLYAIVLGWPGEQLSIRTLTADRFNVEALASAELLTDAAPLALEYQQDNQGLHLNLPAEHPEEMAYVVKLHFPKGIPALKAE